jgi:hypothetical protein
MKKVSIAFQLLLCLLQAGLGFLLEDGFEAAPNTDLDNHDLVSFVEEVVARPEADGGLTSGLQTFGESNATDNFTVNSCGPLLLLLLLLLFVIVVGEQRSPKVCTHHLTHPKTRFQLGLQGPANHNWHLQ